MSWQTYVDYYLMCEIGRGNRLTAAAIIGQDGSVWAQSDSFPAIKPEEVTAIMNDFAEPGSLAPTGLYIGGTKYTVIQRDPGAVIRGKKVNDFASFAPRPLQIGGTEYEVIQVNYCAEPRFQPGRVTIGGTKYRVIQGETGPATRGKKIEPENVTGIVNDFVDPASNYMHIGGTKYTVIQGEPGAFTRGKKGSAGVTIKKTTCALIFGLYDEPVTPGDCNGIVENLGDYLIGQGI